MFSYSVSSVTLPSEDTTFVSNTDDVCVSEDFPALSLAFSGTIGSDFNIGLSSVATITFCNPLNLFSSTALICGLSPDVNCDLSVISCHPVFKFASNTKLLDT